MEPIVLSNISAIHKPYSEEIHQAIEGVISSGHFVKGEAVKIFEQDLKNYLNCYDVVSCGNGTDALYSAIASLNLKKGDEVITTPFSFVSAVECICLLGLTPVFADIDPQNFNINAENIEKLITEKTKAIIPVHLYGRPCDMQRIMDIAKKHNLYVIEDVAQALGGETMIDGGMKKLGTIGDLGCTSFFPTKNLGCFGDGGAVMGNDEELLERVRAFVNHGSRKKYENEMVGINSRLDTIQAAILSVKLNYLDQMNHIRREIAKHYNEQLKDNKAIVLPEICSSAAGAIDGHVFHLYVIRVKNNKRDELMKYLAEKSVQTLIHYPKAIHNLSPYKQYIQEPLPHSDQAQKEVLSLPMYPGLEKEKIDYICALINEWSK